jgi:hypothetical protein
LATVSGCKPSIGDKCTLSTDCSIKGDRQCDTAQPAGYCTVINCGSNGCPDETRCVAFAAAVPGCSYDDRVIARTVKSQCAKPCESDDDCGRSGYVCRDVKEKPWLAKVLDDNQDGRVCVPFVVDPKASVPAEEKNSPACDRRGVDASLPEATLPDGGYVPAPDAGDAGLVADAGSSGDAGAQDAGAGDGATMDGGSNDASSADGGS